MGTVYAGCDGYGLCRVLWVRFMQGVMGTVYAGYDGYGYAGCDGYGLCMV